MIKMFWRLVGVMLVVTGCSQEPAEKPSIEEGPTEKALTLVNASAVDAELLETIRQFMEKELHVMVRTVEKPELATQKDSQTLEAAALRAKHENDAVYILVAKLDGEEHLTVNADSGIAIINAKALYTADAKKFALRIERMAMRAAAFSFGLEPTPDPFCVTRDYRSLQDLDRMGRNYSPPWQGRYAKEVEKRGVEPAKPVEAP